MTKSRSQIALEALDEVAHRAELWWGVGRLPTLVPNDMAEAFWRQKDKLDLAITEEATGGSIANVEYEAGRMVNAWRVLGATAEAAGASPVDRRTMEALLPDGRLAVICADDDSARQAVADNRVAAVWTVEEFAQVIWQFEMVNEAKRVWPGAKVVPARVDPTSTLPKINWANGDDLPEAFRAFASG
jgi:hypothetical protein